MLANLLERMFELYYKKAGQIANLTKSASFSFVEPNVELGMFYLPKYLNDFYANTIKTAEAKISYDDKGVYISRFVSVYRISRDNDEELYKLMGIPKLSQNSVRVDLHKFKTKSNAQEK